MSLRQLVQIKRDPPNLLGTSHQPAHEERTEIMASAYTTPIHRFSFRVEYQALCHLQQAYYIHLLQPLPASNIIILQASITHNISHHLVKCCNFLHIMSVIQWCHQLGTFFDKIVSICVQYQGYLDPDIIGLFCHDYIICTTQTRRYTADPSYHYKYIRLACIHVHLSILIDGYRKRNCRYNTINV